jgi:hypothetical protein
MLRPGWLWDLIGLLKIAGAFLLMSVVFYLAILGLLVMVAGHGRL